MDISEKKRIRKHYKQKRDQMTTEDVSRRSKEICANLIRSQAFHNADCIYAYYPLGNEADLREALMEGWRLGKRIAFPKVFGKEMRFFEVEDFSHLYPGTFGVMEPEEMCPVSWEAPLVLVPGVAFDERGSRMGYGGGYYDKFLARLPGCTTIGIAYELQIADEIPMEPTDAVLDYMVTEDRLWKSSNNYR